MKAETLWKEALSEIADNINQVGFNVYIKDITPVFIENNTITLAVSMNINKNMIEKRYVDVITSALSHAAGYPMSFNIVVSQEPETLIKKEEPEKASTDVFKTLNPKFTFDTFVIGESNEYAHAASLRTAKEPGKINPLFLYGNSGLGKTHLMCSIGNYILKDHPDYNIIYVTTEKFVSDFVSATRDSSDKENKIAEFKKIYRNADVLLIDDIQFLAHKEETQIEFFNTFEALYEKNKQIVITSDRRPQELITLESRLRSRFSSGYIVDITIPKYETRLAILEKKSELMGYNISPEILSYIAQNIKSNVRELEGALIKIFTDSEIKNCPIDLEFTKTALSSIIPDDGIIKITPTKIIDKVCIYYNIKKEDILSDSKKKQIAIARQVAMYLCKELTTLNFVEMSSYFNRDRTTTMYNISKIEVLKDTDPHINKDINYIKQDLQSL